MELDRARRLALPIEAYEVPAHCVRYDERLGAVEEPQEIIADKIVATLDRLTRRGSLKTTDLYDLWFMRCTLAAALPEAELVEAKLHDYGSAPRGIDMAAAIAAVTHEELRAALEGILPHAELQTVDAAAILDVAGAVATALHEVLR